MDLGVIDPFSIIAFNMDIIDHQSSTQDNIVNPSGVYSDVYKSIDQYNCIKRISQINPIARVTRIHDLCHQHNVLLKSCRLPWPVKPIHITISSDIRIFSIFGPITSY